MPSCLFFLTSELECLLKPWADKQGVLLKLNMCSFSNSERNMIEAPHPLVPTDKHT